jgi:hypothetical protein
MTTVLAFLAVTAAGVTLALIGLGFTRMLAVRPRGTWLPGRLPDGVIDLNARRAERTRRRIAS